MKRGFLNTSKANKAVEDAHASAPDPTREQKQPACDPDLSAVKEGSTGTGEPVDSPIDETSAPSPQPTSPSADRKGKGKEKEVDSSKHPNPPEELTGKEFPLRIRPPPGRPGWGYHPLEEELHRVPPHHGSKKRSVFCQWPRDPTGKPIMPCSDDKWRGKLSPDGFPWGATLYDFFFVARLADNPHVLSVMTSSQLLHTMKELGEWKATDDTIKWAESEPDPRDESFPMGSVFLEDFELVVKKGLLNKFSAIDNVRKAAGQGLNHLDYQKTKPEAVGKVEEDAQEDEEMEADEGEGEDEDEDEDEEDDDAIAEDDKQTPEQSGAASNATAAANKVFSVLDMPDTSPFHPSHYPSPWPMIPFAGTLTSALQDRIPLHLLPQTLHVHDPFDLLPAVEISSKGTTWTSRPDIIRTYWLSLTSSALDDIKEARARAEEVEEFKARTMIIMRFARSQTQKDNFEPIIEVPLPPYLKRPTKIEESHLYLSPAAKVGKGHHSVVYNAEWELPRDLFVKPKICDECFKEALEKEKKRLKDIGRWDKMLKVVGWGPKGFTGAIPTQEDLDGVNDPPRYEEGEIIEREITCVVPPGATPMQVLERLEDRGYWKFFMQERQRKEPFSIHFTEDEVYPDTPPKGYRPPPVMRVNPSFSYCDPSHADTVCSHLLVAPVPRTAKFSVVAKLSIQHDEHLEAEAKNYQRFPDHFFQHWSGYTIISQLRAITPVRAIVPQFYGYYIPKCVQNGNNSKPYLSPILLVEHCGTPIDPDKLSIDDKEECASLLLRFQHSGWLHESVYARNILVQKGSPTLYPLKRAVSKDLSFRLIDFGRSRRFSRAEEKQSEEQDVLTLFNDLMGTMSVTLGHR